jgi:hypothetical protein
MKRILIVAAVVVGGVLGLSAAQTSQPAGAVVGVELPLKFPAVGNIDAVKQWKFGRLQDVEQTAGTDIILGIRTDQGLIKVVGPGPQLSELAFRSNWVRTPTRSFPGRSDFAERMIAFDYDPQNRIIALASLEPIFRDRNRLRRAIAR